MRLLRLTKLRRMRLPTCARKAECLAVRGTHRENSLAAHLSSSLRPLKQCWVWSTRDMLVCSLATSNVCLAKGSCRVTLWRQADPKPQKKKKKKSVRAFFQKERHTLRFFCYYYFFQQQQIYNFLAAVGEREQAAPLPTAKGIFAYHGARYNCCFAMWKGIMGRACPSWAEGHCSL